MTTVISSPEQRVVLHGVSWETYERLLAEHQNSSSTRFTYDQGRLEIMILSPEHEEPNRSLSFLVEIVALEMNINVRNFGSTTFKREGIGRGFAPDSCFYLQNAQRIKGRKRLDLSIDPPPDLVIEIDVTSPSLDNFPIFASIGVAEIWRYQEGRVTVYELVGPEYVRREKSARLPPLTGAALSHLMAESERLERTDWVRAIRHWLLENR
ncbi:MAG: Uma2 family endonuclease [Pyrinomonadaceae bacterium]